MNLFFNKELREFSIPEQEQKSIDYLLETEYYEPFNKPIIKNKDRKKLELALDRAWRNRDFEIDKYWSRATYFWAFIAATFAGYIAVMTSDKIKLTFQSELAFVIICMGSVFSMSWLLVNIGSKKWQENWEKHIDMLEDEVTGPLYKTVLNRTAYSVSGINIAVSRFITGVWILLGIGQAIGVPYMADHPLFYGRPDYVICVSALLTAGFLYYLYRNTRRIHKRNSMDKKKYFSFHRRDIHFYGPQED